MLSEDYEQAQYLSSQVEQARQRAVLAASDAGASRDDARTAEQQAREYARGASLVVQGVEQARDAAQAAADRAEAPTDAMVATLAGNPVSLTRAAVDSATGDMITTDGSTTQAAGDARWVTKSGADIAVAAEIERTGSETQVSGDARWVTNTGADVKVGDLISDGESAANGAVDGAVGALLGVSGSATQVAADARITAQVQPVRDFAGESPSVLGQRFDRMSFLCFWEARPVGSVAWCQGFSVNEDTQEIYVSAYDYSIAVPAQWIECRNYDGTLKWRTPNIPVNSTSAYSEGLPWYYNGIGELCFILRIDVDAGGAGLVRTYNSVTNTLSSTIPVAGNSKLFSDGNYFYCTTSVPSLAQLNTVFVYDLASVIAGTPVLIHTVELEKFGAPRQDEKPQGFAAANGVFLASTGKRSGEEEDNGKPGIRIYSSTGSLVSATSYDRLDFRAVLSDLWGPGPVHPTGVNYENEGIYPLRNGSVAVMHMLYENACITIHGSASERKVKTVPPAIQYETPWMPIVINTAGGISEYDSASTPQFKRKGNEVFLRGAFKGVVTIGSSFVLGTLPSGCRPALPNREFNFVSNGTAYWRCRVTNGGNIQVIAYSGTISSSSWLPINGSFIADGS